MPRILEAEATQNATLVAIRTAGIVRTPREHEKIVEYPQNHKHRTPKFKLATALTGTVVGASRVIQPIGLRV